MSDLIERPIDAADPTYPDAERCAQTLEACEDDLLTEAQFVRWQGQEIERLRQWETCGREWLDKTDWVQQRMNSGDLPSTALGKHRADVMREEIERLTEENRRLRADLLAGRNVVNAGLTIHTLTIERDMLRQEIERLTAERDKAQSKYERQREATVNTYARVRRLIEALRVTGQHSNRWKLKYKSQVPSLKRTIRALCAERDELRRQLAEAQKELHNLNWALGTEGYDQMATPEEQAEHEAAVRAHHDVLERLEEGKRAYEAMKQDAQRYRWLRNEASTARKCDPMVCIYPLDEQDLIDGDRLDVAIDAAMGASNE